MIAHPPIVPSIPQYPPELYRRVANVAAKGALNNVSVNGVSVVSLVVPGITFEGVMVTVPELVSDYGADDAERRWPQRNRTGWLCMMNPADVQRE